MGLSSILRKCDVFDDRRKLFSLVSLTTTTSATALTVHYSRTSSARLSGQSLYLGCVAVLLSEIVKIFFCLVGVMWQHRENRKNDLYGLRTILHLASIHWRDTLRLIVPAVSYMIQNNLSYFALTHLDAASYQITFQLKIFTTAFLYILWLKRRLTLRQWFAVFLLFYGVVMVQWSALDHSHVTSNNTWKNKMWGGLTVLFCCCLSSFSGVYFEYLLKNNVNCGEDVSMFIRNIQLGFFSVPLNCLNIWFSVESQVIMGADGGLLQGFNSITYLVVLLQATSGLIVASVLKFADNIHKNFATSASLLLSTLVSWLWLSDFNHGLSVEYFFGSVMVMTSIFLYSSERQRDFH